MKCKRYDTLIHLFLDGRLDGERERRLKDHLATCRHCAEKLAFLEATEKKARTLEPGEPPQEYWNTFSGRVMAGIEAGKRKEPAFNIGRMLAGLFSMSPAGLRIAAGVVSVALVVTVTILYINRHGGDIVPPRTAEQPARQPGTEIRAEENGGIPEQSPDRAEELTGGEGAEKRAVEETAPAPVKDEEPTKKREARTLAVEKTTDKARTYVDGTRGRPAMNAETEIPYMAAGDGFDLDGTAVPRIGEADTLMPESVLRTVIDAWNSYMEEYPSDSLTLQGYEQVATGYVLLARLGARDSDIAEGVKRIEEYAGRADDPALRNILLDKLQKIHALRKQ